MLAIGYWLINRLHLCGNLFVEVWGGQEVLKVWLLHVKFISRVAVVELFCASWSPPLKGDEIIIEDFLGIDLDQASIAIICNSTTIVGLGNQILNGLPRDGLLFVILLICNAILQASHVNCKQIFADRIVGVVEVIGDVPSEGLELLTLDQDSMEPTKTIYCLSEFSLLVNVLEGGADIIEEPQHVRFYALRWLLSDLERSLKE